MTPIGSTSSNIRRAIEFIVHPPAAGLAPCPGHFRSLGRLSAAELIAQLRLTAQEDDQHRPVDVPGPHGRTLMIVFPVRRSVRLSAPTASSRVATLPMF